MLYFMNDVNYIQADVYAVFHRMMKLGIKHLYIDRALPASKGRIIQEDNDIFYAPTINVRILNATPG